MATRKVIVGGGTGYIGSHLIRALNKEGYKAVSVSRDAEKASLTWKDIEKCGLPNDTHAVINVAGLNVFGQLFWSDSFKKEIRTSRIDTTKTLANAIGDTKAETFVTISGVAYYKPDANQSYTEDSKCEAYDFFSQLCHDWEAAAKIPGNKNIRQAIIRSGVVLGKDSGIDKNLRLIFKTYVGGTIGDGCQYMPWIHIDDLTSMFLFSIKNPNVSGILNGVAPQVITNSQFTEAYAKGLGVFALFPMPKIMAKMVFHPERAVMLLDGQKIEPKHVTELGFQYQYGDITKACQTMA